MPIPLDEYPIHQAPLSIAHPASSDRNFYDRCYLNAHDRTGEVFAITGLGVYPNLGVIDAYLGVRSGDRQVTIRASDALGDDRLRQEVGPYRLEVVEPLQELRITVDAAEHGVEADLRWRGSFPIVDEQPHLWRQGPRVILEAQRMAQVGTWEGRLRVDESEWELTPDRWVGTRDRSWGIRPVGEPDPPGRGAAETPPDYGFWWIYVPMRFDDFAVLFIAQEDRHGHRTLNDAVRVWPASSGRPVEQLGWPRYEVHYRPGTREAVGATITACAPDGTPLVFEVESKGFIALNTGLGYGTDAEWNHGRWLGRGVVQRADFDYTSPEAPAKVAFGTIDHVGRATLGSVEGWGLFEHMSIGAHAPSGFTDFGSVAP